MTLFTYKWSRLVDHSKPYINFWFSNGYGSHLVLTIQKIGPGFCLLKLELEKSGFQMVTVFKWSRFQMHGTIQNQPLEYQTSPVFRSLLYV